MVPTHVQALLEPTPPPAQLVCIEDGDLLDCDVEYIVHQCNCLTTRGLGLAASLFRKYPHADVYTDGSDRIPGTIVVRGGAGEGAGERGVVNLFGQFRPGKPARAGVITDTAVVREKWFRAGLAALAARGGGVAAIGRLPLPHPTASGHCFRVFLICERSTARPSSLSRCSAL